MSVLEDYERLKNLCSQFMLGRGFSDEHIDRLREELRSINGQNECEYFLDLYDKKVKFPYNENNLLVAYLLGIVDDFDISKEPAFVMGDYPDIDVDYIQPVREYLKKEWASKKFGRYHVCNVGNYSTFGIKSTLKDMARVHGLDVNEINAITTKIGLKDEDGKNLTFDKAVEEYSELRMYCEDHPGVAEACRKLINRNRGKGKHAGGLIISSKRIDDFVPLMTDNDGNFVSAWVEGLHGQDLGPVGLVKYDPLGVVDIDRCGEICELVKDRHNLDFVCSNPFANEDWSNTDYLEDPAALRLANEGNLLGIFQFDSPGIQRLAKGNTTCFNDMVAFTGLYRPACLAMHMHDAYIKRKRGEEEFEIPEILQPFLGKTYGVIIYQEQVMQVLHAVGKIPLKDCYDVIKAISKKKIEKFQKYKDMFISGGQETLGWSRERMEQYFKEIEAFSGYGFNLAHAVCYTVITMRLLYLKTHYPLEFYTKTLSLEKDIDTIREYMADAKKNGISIKKMDINKSKTGFTINDEEKCIYYGIADIKGIGKGVAEKIVRLQPYSGVQDFLTRFGTDAKAVNPMITLGQFEGNKFTQYKYYDAFIDWRDKHKKRDKTYQKNKDNKYAELKGILSPIIGDEIEISFHDERLWEQYEQAVKEKVNDDDLKAAVLEKMVKIKKSYLKCVDAYKRKCEIDDMPTMQSFPVDFVSIGSKIEKLCYDEDLAELEYYGFVWSHPLEKSPDYTGGCSFEKHRKIVDALLKLKKEDPGRYARYGDSSLANYVECRILKVVERVGKNNKKNYSLYVDDENGEQQVVKVWLEDMERFLPELQPNNLVKIRLFPPDGGFPTYTLYSPPPWRREREIPKNKAEDYRVISYKNKEKIL